MQEVLYLLVQIMVMCGILMMVHGNMVILVELNFVDNSPTWYDK